MDTGEGHLLQSAGVPVQPGAMGADSLEGCQQGRGARHRGRHGDRQTHVSGLRRARLHRRHLGHQ